LWCTAAGEVEMDPHENRIPANGAYPGLRTMQ
jgi:hypothetical protein